VHGTLTAFRERFGRGPEVSVLPDEIALSPPLPVAPGRVVVFGYWLIGRPPDDPSGEEPRYRFTADSPGGKVLKVERLHPSGSGAWRVLGKAVPPPAYRHMEYEKYQQVETEYDELYELALEEWFAGRRLEGVRARRLRELLTVFGKEPLFDLFRKTNRDFFWFLE
jgi:hypothetical protein